MDRLTLLPLIEAAVRAPSSHNTQPWRFQLHQDRIDLFADRTRALPVNDPRDRELTISCGAALFNLRVAAAARGLSTRVDVRPDPAAPDLLARVQLAQGAREADLVDLHLAIDARRTTRQAFQPESLADPLVHALIAVPSAEGAHLQSVDGDARTHVAALVADGDRLQFGNPRWRHELATWMRAPHTGEGLATPALMAPLARVMVRRLNLGARVAATDAELARQAPLLAILATDRDTPEAWLTAGQALERMLLVAATHGVLAGYLNQPCQLDVLRVRLAAAVTPDRYPQVLVRLGTPVAPLRRAPRRPVADVLVDR